MSDGLSPIVDDSDELTYNDLRLLRLMLDAACGRAPAAWPVSALAAKLERVILKAQRDAVADTQPACEFPNMVRNEAGQMVEDDWVPDEDR